MTEVYITKSLLIIHLSCDAGVEQVTSFFFEGGELPGWEVS